MGRREYRHPRPACGGILYPTLHFLTLHELLQKATKDCAHICKGTTLTDCHKKCNGTAITDRCNKCVQPEDACKQDCAGKYGGTAKVDKCGKCGGDGKCPSKQCDMCNVCDTDPSNDCKQDCMKKWGGKMIKD